WRSERPFPQPLPDPTPGRERAVAAEIAAACPPPAEDDPTPGLSAGARKYEPPPPPPGVHCILRVPTVTEVADLSTLLAATPRTHPDRPKLMDRLAWNLVILEYESYHACRDLRAPD